MATATGKFITKEELGQLKTQQSCSGMFLSGGQRMGNPGAMAADLCKKYDMSGCGINLKDGQFHRP